MDKSTDKLIILVRHGHYDFTSRDISERGTAQINELSTLFQKFIGENTVLYCGSDKICLHTTEIIEKNLGMEARVIQTLLCSDGGYPDCEGLLALIEESEAPIIILVTHLAQAGHFPNYLSQTLNSSESFECPSMGGAILLRIKKGKIKSLFLPREIKKLKTFVKSLPSMPG